MEGGLEQRDSLRSWAERAAVAVLAAAAAVAWVAARRWPPPPVPPERLARAFVVGAFLLVGVAQLLAGLATWLDAAESAGDALSGVAFPLALVAAVAGFAALLARSRRDTRRW